MSEAGAAARRVREAAAIALPIQLGRAAVETAIEAALVAMVARGRLEWAAALAAARLIEELTLGSATDHATTRALDRRDPWARIGDGVRAGLLRTGLPLALLIAPAIVIARGAMLGQVRVVLAAATVGLVAMIAAIALHLKHGTAYAALSAEIDGRGARLATGILAMAVSVGMAFVASSLAHLAWPHADVPKVVAINLASVATRPWALAMWRESLRSAGPAPRR